MKTLEEIYNFLKDKEVHSGAINEQKLGSMHVVTIFIEGDWKHDHGYLNYLMQTFGYVFVGYESIMETGSDWYPAIHKFVDAEHLDFFSACMKMFAA